MFENILFIIVLIFSVGFSLYFYIDAIRKEHRIIRNKQKPLKSAISIISSSS